MPGFSRLPDTRGQEPRISSDGEGSPSRWKPFRQTAAGERQDGVHVVVGVPGRRLGLGTGGIATCRQGSAGPPSARTREDAQAASVDEPVRTLVMFRSSDASLSDLASRR